MGVAVLTGGSSGIGQAAAVRIAERGNGVVLTYNTNPAGAKETVAMIEEGGGSAVALHLDVSRPETFAGFADLVRDQLRDRWQRPTFDYLVNNAGFAQPDMFADVSLELFERYFDVLLRGPFFLTQTLLPVMADGGAIVNTTSSCAVPGGTAVGYCAHASMKGGLITLSRCLAKELAPRGIRVNGVSPGPTRTRISNDAFARFPEAIPELAALTALGRIGEADDVGKVIAALLSDEFGWMTGENVEISGGFQL
jgi:NAD(P)-dependent dehydrogenase (short-subunit alcohol dehydrogenase family)